MRVWTNTVHLCIGRRDWATPKVLVGRCLSQKEQAARVIKPHPGYSQFHQRFHSLGWWCCVGCHSFDGGACVLPFRTKLFEEMGQVWLLFTRQLGKHFIGHVITCKAVPLYWVARALICGFLCSEESILYIVMYSSKRHIESVLLVLVPCLGTVYIKRYAVTGLMMYCRQKCVYRIQW